MIDTATTSSRTTNDLFKHSNVASSAAERNLPNLKAIACVRLLQSHLFLGHWPQFGKDLLAGAAAS